MHQFSEVINAAYFAVSTRKVECQDKRMQAVADYLRDSICHFILNESQAPDLYYQEWKVAGNADKKGEGNGSVDD